MLSATVISLGGSVDDVEAGVAAQALWNDDAVGCLVVFEQCGHNARQSQCRAVEGVAQVYLLVCIAIAAFQTVGLICLEVGYGRNFEPAFLCGAENFEVESYGAGEGHIAAAEA